MLVPLTGDEMVGMVSDNGEVIFNQPLGQLSLFSLCPCVTGLVSRGYGNGPGQGRGRDARHFPCRLRRAWTRHGTFNEFRPLRAESYDGTVPKDSCRGGDAHRSRQRSRVDTIVR